MSIRQRAIAAGLQLINEDEIELELAYVEVDSVSRKGNPDYFNIKRSLTTKSPATASI